MVKMAIRQLLQLAIMATGLSMVLILESKLKAKTAKMVKTEKTEKMEKKVIKATQVILVQQAKMVKTEKTEKMAFLLCLLLKQIPKIM